MAIEFVVEDGTAKSDATSYIAVADADQYWENRGDTAGTWGGSTDDQKKVALILATFYLDTIYSVRWQGWRTKEGGRESDRQALAWPRFDVVDYDGWVVDNDIVPQAVQDACCELAWQSRNGDELIPNLDPSDNGLVQEMVKVGPLQVMQRWKGERSALKRYTNVERMLRPLLISTTTIQRA